MGNTEKWDSDSEKSKDVLPKIICHDGFSGGSIEFEDNNNANHLEPFKFIDEKEKIAYETSYFEFSYDESGNCKMTKKLQK